MLALFTVPPYHAKHDTVPTPWSHTEDLVRENATVENTDGTTEVPQPITKQPVDFSYGPPSYQEKYDGQSKKVSYIKFTFLVQEHNN